MPETGDLVRYALKLATGTGKEILNEDAVALIRYRRGGTIHSAS